MDAEWAVNLALAMVVLGATALVWHLDHSRASAKKQTFAMRHELRVWAEEKGEFDRLWGDRPRWTPLCGIAVAASLAVPVPVPAWHDSLILFYTALVVAFAPALVWWSRDQFRLQSGQPGTPGTARLADFAGEPVRVANVVLPIAAALLTTATQAAGLHSGPGGDTFSWALVCVVAGSAVYAEIAGRRLAALPRLTDGSSQAYWHDALRSRAIQSHYAMTLVLTFLSVQTASSDHAGAPGSHTLPGWYDALAFVPVVVMSVIFGLLLVSRRRFRDRLWPGQTPQGLVFM